MKGDFLVPVFKYHLRARDSLYPMCCIAEPTWTLLIFEAPSSALSLSHPSMDIFPAACLTDSLPYIGFTYASSTLGGSDKRSYL